MVSQHPEILSGLIMKKEEKEVNLLDVQVISNELFYHLIVHATAHKKLEFIKSIVECSLIIIRLKLKSVKVRSL